VSKEKMVEDIITGANTIELVKHALAAVGLVYLAPLEESILDEQISKAIVAKAHGEAK
jgi:hypothetical protein